MVQLEVLQYSNSMHSVYQAQYPKLFSYIADTYYLWTHTGNKRVLQLIIQNHVQEAPPISNQMGF